MHTLATRKTPASSQTAASKRSVVPILETIESIKGYPEKLIIFRVPASPFWWTRYFDGKPIKRSTKTTNKRDAIAFAKQFYETLLVNKRLGKSNNPRETSFIRAAEEVLEDDARKAERGELSASYVANHKSVIRGHIADFLGKYEVGDIDYAVLDKFKTYLAGKALSTSTIKLNFVFVKKILDHAQRKGVIQSTPLLPKTKTEDNARGYFALPEYALLRRSAHRLRGKRFELKRQIGDGEEDGDPVKYKKLRNIDVTDEIALLIPFMVYTFIRPTDLKQIKHRHIEIRQGQDGKDYLWMPIPTSKKHDKPMTSMPRAAIFYKRLKANRLAELRNPKAKLDDEYVFMPQHLNRAYAYRQLARQFDVLLEQTALRESTDGEARTLYSLRHTSLMYRLRYGGHINPLILANNARTSVEMLERFYLKQLESSHVTADLHAKKVTTRKRRAEPAVKRGKMLIVTQPEGSETHQPHGPQSTSISSTGAGVTLNFDGIAVGDASGR